MATNLEEQNFGFHTSALRVKNASASVDFYVVSCQARGRDAVEGGQMERKFEESGAHECRTQSL
eukprot:2251170-Rhodomonas_salina.1